MAVVVAAIVLLSSAGSAHGDVVAKYTFDDDTAQDSSGLGHHGTVVGSPSPVTGFLGLAWHFDGIDDYLVVSDTVDLRLDTFAVTVWLRTEKIPTQDATVLEKWQDGRGYRLLIDGVSGALEFEIGGGLGTSYVVQAPFPVFGNVWTTATATYDGVELALYVDGSLVAHTAVSGLDITNEADLFIAADAAQDRLFNGDIDEVVIENATAVASDVCTMAQKLWHASSQTCLEGYTNVTDELGLGDLEHNHFGICLVDVDQDGWIDVYYANGVGEPSLPEEPVDGVCQELDGIPPHSPASENTFYLNLGDGTFSPDIAGEVGIKDIWTAMQHVFGDYDNDGLRDLMSHNFVRSPLYHAVSADPMLFEDVSEEAGVELCLLRGTGASWVDLDQDGWLDLYTVEFIGGVSPDQHLSAMYINNQDGTFTEITAEAGVNESNNPMGVTFGDYDNDGDQDIFLTASPPALVRLYRHDGVNPDTGLPHFTDVAAEAGLTIADDTNLGVATAWGDYNNDGYLDLLFAREYDSHLWRNDGPNADGVWTFTDVSAQGGLDFTAVNCYGINFTDLDNDGWLDIVLTNFDINGPNRVFMNSRDGAWTEVAETLGLQLPGEKQMDYVAADLDNDGDLELVLLGFQFGHPNTVFRSESRGNNWIQFRLTGTVSNRDAVGTRITLTAAAQPGQPAFEQIREVTAGTGFFSDFPRIQTIGLGKARVADEVRINWPSGQELTLVNVPINQRLDILEGAPPPEPIPTSLSIAGPTLLVGSGTYAFTATADYYYALPGDATAETTWSVVPSDYAEFVAPGELAVSAVPVVQTIELKAVLGEFEDSLSIVIQPASVVDEGPPSLTVVEGISLTTEQPTVTLSGGATDDVSAIAAVIWENDRGGSGPCVGLTAWSTGPIALTEGLNAITVTAFDAADNRGSMTIMVERIAAPIDDAPPPVDDEEPDPETPDEPDDIAPPEDDDATDSVPDPEAPATADEPPDAPQPDGGDDESETGIEEPIETSSPSPASATCGLFGVLNFGLLLFGLTALRRRSR